MSNLAATPTAEACVSEPAGTPTLEVLPGRLTDIGGLPIRRLLPRSQRRLVGPWCFLDSYGPLTFSSGKPMDVAPHPHIGLQTVSWLLDGEVVHHDSLGLEGAAGPGVLNLMTAGKGIAHAEETPPVNVGRLRGLQLWVALPDATRETAPAFEQHRELPIADLEGGSAKVVLGEVAGARSPARAFSPIVAAEVSGRPGLRVTIPLEPRFEHALVLLQGGGRLDGQPLAVDTLYYLGCGRRELTIDRGRRAHAGVPPRRRSVRRDGPHVVELRGPHHRRDRGRARGLGGRAPLRRGPRLPRGPARRSAVRGASRAER